MTDEKRKENRLKEENEVIITIASGELKPSGEKPPHNYCKDISPSGAKIHGNVPLPIDTVGGAQEEPKAAELSRCVLEIG